MNADAIFDAEAHAKRLVKEHGFVCRCDLCVAGRRAITRAFCLRRFESLWFQMSRRQQDKAITDIATMFGANG